LLLLPWYSLLFLALNKAIVDTEIRLDAQQALSRNMYTCTRLQHNGSMDQTARRICALFS
jgi:hypothetical protein